MERGVVIQPEAEIATYCPSASHLEANVRGRTPCVTALRDETETDYRIYIYPNKVLSLVPR